MASPARKSIPPEIQAGVLDQSRRRCALCFYLTDDLTEKHGQIAHLDGNPANFAEDNLAFLCLPHHSVFDSTTSQHKNYTIAEVKAARERLYQAIAAGRHVNYRAVVVTAGHETDRQMLEALVRLMADSHTDRFLRDFDFGGQTFHLREFNALDEYVQNAEGAAHEFIDRALEALRQDFISAYGIFRGLLPRYTAPVPWTPTYRGVPQDWRTTAPRRFNTTVKRLRTAANQACVTYDELVRTARERLAP